MAEYKLPAGFEDEAAFLADARECYRVDVEADKVNRDAAFDDLKFACDYREGPGATHGAQWDDAVVRQRVGRPCLTSNVMPQYIGQIVGDNRINRPAIKVRPAEDADEELAEVRAGIIRYIEAQSNAQWIYTTALQAAATCGIGHFRVGLDWADNGSFLRTIRIKPIANPLSVIWDRLSVERTGKDAKRCFIEDAIPTKDFEKQWPDAMPGGFGDADRELMADGWLMQDTVRVCEYWRLEEEKRTLALFEDGKTEDITGQKVPPLNVKETREVSKTKACMWLITGFSVLEGPFEVPIDRIPVFRCYGRVFFVGNSRVWFGLTRFMKDPQRLQNYADSMIAESLALAPKQQWEVTQQAVEGREETIRGAHKSGDPIIVFNDQGERKRLDPPPMPVGALQWRQLLTQQLKDISGLHDASLGIQSNETSGKAIIERKREGDVATIEYHDNHTAAIAEGGRVIDQLIPVVMDTAQQVRILGSDEKMKVIRVNDPDDPESYDMSRGQFDIVVETGPSYSTKRAESAEQIVELIRSVPEIGAVAGDLLVGNLDLPDGDKLVERLKKALPPQFQEGKDPKDMTPEEQAAFAQQQEQQQEQAAQEQQQTQQLADLAMQGAQADVALKQANVAKAEAEAAKIMREAEVPEQAEQQTNPVVDMAEARKAMAEADSAEANAMAARAKAREAEANALMAEQRARMAEHQAGMAETDRMLNDMDAMHKVEHGRGITDPEPPAEGAEKAA